MYHKGQHALVTTWKFFSYYTTLTNILVGMWAFLSLVQISGVLGEAAHNANAVTAITFYIVTVGIGNYMMFSIKELNLLRKFADLSVHAVVPAMMLIYWLLYIDKASISFKFVHYWMIYPIVYAAYTLMHGVWTGFYPYPFVNVKALGANRVLLNACVMALSVLIGGFLFVGLAKLLSAL